MWLSLQTFLLSKTESLSIWNQCFVHTETSQPIWVAKKMAGYYYVMEGINFK